MTLSLIVPVSNDPDGLRRVLEQAAAMGVFSEIVVADDASDPPMRECLSGDPLPAGVRWLSSEEHRGAGHARNMGLDAATGTHVLFFDADDILRPELAGLVTRLEGRAFDFCLFRHVESRLRDEGREDMYPRDVDLWRLAGALRGEDPAEVPGQGLPALARIVAYPWNKIYRTGFLRDNGIRCTETLVHNDLALHWLGFVHATRVLASQTVGCEHVVETGSTHLTNLSGPERLALFDALEHVLSHLEGAAARRFEPDFTLFYLDLIEWAAPRIDADLQPRFRRKAADLVLGRLRGPRYALVNTRHPFAGTLVNRLVAEAP